jgi:hypothetical protein
MSPVDFEFSLRILTVSEKEICWQYFANWSGNNALVEGGSLELYFVKLSIAYS